MAVDHGIPPRGSSSTKDHERFTEDLQRQRAQAAGNLATWAAEVRDGRRAMTAATRQAIVEAASQLHRLDAALADL